MLQTVQGKAGDYLQRNNTSKLMAQFFSSFWFQDSTKCIKRWGFWFHRDLYILKNLRSLLLVCQSGISSCNNFQRRIVDDLLFVEALHYVPCSHYLRQGKEMFPDCLVSRFTLGFCGTVITGRHPTALGKHSFNLGASPYTEVGFYVLSWIR